jgi:hypothetical protein
VKCRRIALQLHQKPLAATGYLDLLLDALD